ncbi:MAG: HAMP domain-containing histidine kinase [candidate division KSB1 bacterium]|nr:HAMP domain-containing histidine kinase [candidate division KSB1 bacterium]
MTHLLTKGISRHLREVLFLLAIALILGLLWYTQSLVRQLRREARDILEFYASFYQRAATDASDEELNFIFEQIIQRTNFPIVVTDNRGEPSAWKGIDVDPNDRSPQAISRVRQIVRHMAKEIDPIPLRYEDYVIGHLYYGDSKLITQLVRLPYIEIGLVSLFLFVAFLGYSSIKRSEQQLIWVGLSRETAHQLGTPISSLLGWLELLRTADGIDRVQEIAQEMAQDLARLGKVASRFSQIGSRADLKEQEVEPILRDVATYFRRRIPQMGKTVVIREEYHPVPKVPLNRELFEWVIENLVKNGLEALEKDPGIITLRLCPAETKGWTLQIDVTDNGRGMDARERKRIFQPGYSTKRRGWGLGLSLAKRIVEEYHHGRLFVRWSQPGEGTTMRVLL